MSIWERLTAEEGASLLKREKVRIRVLGADHPLFGWGLYKRADRSGDPVVLCRRERLEVWRRVTGQ